jgi:hypothetical protein
LPGDSGLARRHKELNLNNYARDDYRISEENESIIITGDFDQDGAEQECFELVGAYRGVEKVGSHLEHPNWQIFIKRKGGGILTECPLP